MPIPESGRSMIELHLGIARTTPSDTYAEEELRSAEAMLSYACAVAHISPSQFATELVTTQLIREQRKNNAVTNN